MTDRWGLDVTVPESDPQAMDRFEQLLLAYVTFSPALPERMADAMTAPAPPLAEITTACLLLQAHTASDHGRASAIAARLDEADRGGATALDRRERAHLDALRFLTAGHTDAAADTWDTLLVQWPTDLLALRLCHFTLFNRGRLADMRRSVERSIAAWGELPFRTHLDGMLAFALEELGDYRRAEDLGRSAVECDPTDLWSVHAVAHVLEMEARTAEGLAWFTNRDRELVGAFARHLWWHHAIIHLRTGDHRRLLELYDTHIQPGPALDGLSLTNAIDLLARLEFAGADVGGRWSSLLDGSRHRLGFHDHPFNDSHYAYALARLGAIAEVKQLLDGMAGWRDRPTTAARVIEQVGLDTATAMAALGAGDRATAVECFARSRGRRWMLGGSHAQRSLFDLAERCSQGR